MNQYIESIEIKNFQGYTHSKFEFVDGFNVIIGSTNAGKSTLIRAIKWCILNRPSAGFRNWYVSASTEMFVRINFKDGYIKRIKNTKFNGYEGESSSIPAFKLEALRTDVPEEIKIISGLNDINIQGQHEKFYLLQDWTPGEIGKKISEAVDLQIIDSVKTVSNTYLDKVVTRKNNVERELTDTNEKLSELSYLDAVEKLILEITNKIRFVEETNDKIQRVQKISVGLQIAKEDKKEIQEWLNIVPLYQKIKKEITHLTGTLYPSYNKIELLKDELVKWQNKQKDLQTKFPKREVIQDLIEKSKALQTIKIQHDKIKTIHNELLSYRSLKDDTKELTETLKEKRKVLFNELKVCPFCNKEITDTNENISDGGCSHNGSSTQKPNRQLLRNRKV